MQWTHVARKDFADAIRSRMFIALSVLMLLLSLGLFFGLSISTDEGITFEQAATTMVTPLLFLVPLIGLIVGYMAIIAERESGSIRIMLSLPLERSDVMLGKFIGRLGVTIVPIILAFSLALPAGFFLFEELQLTQYIEFVAYISLLGIVFVAIAVGVSGMVATRGKVLGIVVFFYFLFEQLWTIVPTAVYWAINREMPTFDDPPTWYEFINVLAPDPAIRNALGGVFFEGAGLGNDIGWWISAVVVILWIVVPLGIGYLRFKSANLN